MSIDKSDTLNQEWVDLILAALDLGLDIEEIRNFFASESVRNNCRYTEIEIQ